MAKIGKHSALLAIDPDPLAYARRQVLKANEAQKNNKISMNLEIDFDEKLSTVGDISSKSNLLNTGYFILQKIYHYLAVADFFKVSSQTIKPLSPAMTSIASLPLQES